MIGSLVTVTEAAALSPQVLKSRVVRLHRELRFPVRVPRPHHSRNACCVGHDEWGDQGISDQLQAALFGADVKYILHQYVFGTPIWAPHIHTTHRQRLS